MRTSGRAPSRILRIHPKMEIPDESHRHNTFLWCAAHFELRITHQRVLIVMLGLPRRLLLRGVCAQAIYLETSPGDCFAVIVERACLVEWANRTRCHGSGGKATWPRCIKYTISQNGKDIDGEVSLTCVVHPLVLA